VPEFSVRDDSRTAFVGGWRAMSDVYDDLPAVERPEPFRTADEADSVSLDSEVDFDDERDDDQLPLDIVEAAESGALLDDPETFGEDDDDAG